MSATRTSPMNSDPPAPVRLISEIALIASATEEPPIFDRPSVPLTRHDLDNRRSAQRLPGRRRRPNAEAAHGNVGSAMRISCSDAAAIRLTSRHSSLRGFVSYSV